MDKASQLSLIQWMLEQVRIAEECVRFLESLSGTFAAERDPTINYLKGYIRGLNNVINRED